MMDKRSIPNQFNLDGTMNINAAKDKRYILGEACIMNNETGTSVGCKLGLEDGQWGNDFPWLSSTILDKCRESFETSETFWDMYARLPETSDKELEEITKIATPYSDGFELPEDVAQK